MFLTHEAIFDTVKLSVGNLPESNLSEMVCKSFNIPNSSRLFRINGVRYFSRKNTEYDQDIWEWGKNEPSFFQTTLRRFFNILITISYDIFQ